MNIECSFCGLDMRHAPRMISGPKVYICADCVGLCTEILVDEKKSDDRMRLHGAAQKMGELREQLEASDRDRKHMRTFLRLAIRNLNEAIGKNPQGSYCTWCDQENLDNEDARRHAAACEKHPAVIRLRELEGECTDDKRPFEVDDRDGRKEAAT